MALNAVLSHACKLSWNFSVLYDLKAPDNTPWSDGCTGLCADYVLADSCYEILRDGCPYPCHFALKYSGDL